MGLFPVFPKRGFGAKTGLKLGAILENATIPGKWRRTPKFIPARDKNGNSHLGRYLLRSARSKPDRSAFVLEHVATDATTLIPQTVVTSRPLSPAWPPLGPVTTTGTSLAPHRDLSGTTTGTTVEYSGDTVGTTVEYSGDTVEATVVYP